MSILLLIAGIALLAVVADRFVAAASRLADRLGVSMLVIGVVVMGMGTSLPELLVSAGAAASGRAEEALGNIVGSNVANVTLVLGVAAVGAPLLVRSSVARREAPLAVAATAAYGLGVLAAGTARYAASAALALIGVAATVSLLRANRNRDDVLAEEAAEEVLADEQRHAGEHLPTLIAVNVGLLVALVASSQLLLTGAVGVSEMLGIPPIATGVVLLALGTSLPELAATVAAARADEADLVVGNLMGSNLFNSTFVAAAAFAAGPVPDTPVWVLALPVVVGAVAWWFMSTANRVTRAEGVVLFGIFAVSVTALVIGGVGVDG